jgi:hypothetical protein
MEEQRVIQQHRHQLIVIQALLIWHAVLLVQLELAHVIHHGRGIQH